MFNELLNEENYGIINSKSNNFTSDIMTKKGEDRVCDYSAHYYLQVIVRDDSTFFFDRDAIDKIFFRGYGDEEKKLFRREVLNTLGELEVRDEQIVPVE